MCLLPDPLGETHYGERVFLCEEWNSERKWEWEWS